jgi:hypothetical protein
MAGSPRSLRDLVESRAATHGLALRTLWGWTLDAIVAASLIPVLPAGTSLDTPFDHGGMPLTWRKVIGLASHAIKRHTPENDNWANTLMFDPDVFDKWFTHASQTRVHRARSPIPEVDAGNLDKPPQRTRPVRGRAETVIKALYPNGVPEQTVEANKRLIERVCDELKNRGWQSIKPDSILRAAGRRGK